MKKFSLIAFLLLSTALFFTSVANARQTLDCYQLKGATVLAQDSSNTFLGKMTSRYQSDSVLNRNGNYGGEYKSNSVWNRNSEFGSEYKTYSANNRHSTKPPIIIKDGRRIGYLTVSEYQYPSITPNLLKALCSDKF